MDPKNIISNKRVHSFKHLILQAPQIKNEKIYRLLSPSANSYKNSKKPIGFTSASEISANIAYFYNSQKEKDSLIRFSFSNSIKQPPLTMTDMYSEPTISLEQYERYLLSTYQIESLFSNIPDILKVAESLQEYSVSESPFKANIPTRQEVDLLSSWVDSKLLECKSSKQFILMYSIGLVEIARQCRVFCKERGILLAKLWLSFVKLQESRHQNFKHKINLLQEESALLAQEREKQVSDQKATIQKLQEECTTLQKIIENIKCDNARLYKDNRDRVARIYELRDINTYYESRINSLDQENKGLKYVKSYSKSNSNPPQFNHTAPMQSSLREIMVQAKKSREVLSVPKLPSTQPSKTKLPSTIYGDISELISAPKFSLKALRTPTHKDESPKGGFQDVADHYFASAKPAPIEAILEELTQSVETQTITEEMNVGIQCDLLNNIVTQSPVKPNIMQVDEVIVYSGIQGYY